MVNGHTSGHYFNGCQFGRVYFKEFLILILVLGVFYIGVVDPRTERGEQHATHN